MRGRRLGRRRRSRWVAGPGCAGGYRGRA